MRDLWFFRPSTLNRGTAHAVAAAPFFMSRDDHRAAGE